MSAAYPKRKFKCLNDPDSFCYICGLYIYQDQRSNITDFVQKAYAAYFKMKIGDEDKSWAPHIVCRSCVENLRRWTKGTLKCLAFGIPMIWREPRNHEEDCYFCITNILGFTKKKST